MKWSLWCLCKFSTTFNPKILSSLSILKAICTFNCFVCQTSKTFRTTIYKGATTARIGNWGWMHKHRRDAEYCCLCNSHYVSLKISEILIKENFLEMRAQDWIQKLPDFLLSELRRMRKQKWEQKEGRQKWRQKDRQKWKRHRNCRSFLLDIRNGWMDIKKGYIFVWLLIISYCFCL